jgi:hypothetical protein
MNQNDPSESFDPSEWSKQLAIQVIRLVSELPKTEAAAVIGGHLLRCAPAVGAQMERAKHANSPIGMLKGLDKV